MRSRDPTGDPRREDRGRHLISGPRSLDDDGRTRPEALAASPPQRRTALFHGLTDAGVLGRLRTVLGGSDRRGHRGEGHRPSWAHPRYRHPDVEAARHPAPTRARAVGALARRRSHPAQRARRRNPQRPPHRDGEHGCDTGPPLACDPPVGAPRNAAGARHSGGRPPLLVGEQRHRGGDGTEADGAAPDELEGRPTLVSVAHRGRRSAHIVVTPGVGTIRIAPTLRHAPPPGGPPPSRPAPAAPAPRARPSAPARRRGSAAPRTSHPAPAGPAAASRLPRARAR